MKYDDLPFEDSRTYTEIVPCGGVLIAEPIKIFLVYETCEEVGFPFFSFLTEKENKKMIGLKVLNIQSASNGGADVSLVFWK